MNRIATASEKERLAIFSDVAAIKKIPVSMIEKDFWVCWTLEKLFTSPPLCKILRFKGGTSLSKVFHLINRFSEDIDLILDWRCVSELNPMDERSKTKQDLFNKEIEALAGAYITQTILPLVSAVCGQCCRVTPDASDDHVLNVVYPGVSKSEYLSPTVKLEIGPLAAWSPHETASLQSYVAECNPELGMQPVQLPTICAERTFWEKATILHHEHHRPETIQTPSRYSRHYYDLHMIGQSEVKDRALAQDDLLSAVVAFKQKFYPRGWANYEQAKRGTLRLLPSLSAGQALAKDYQAMRAMIFGPYPSWESILEGLAALEHEINRE
jgi:hypothetical protein